MLPEENQIISDFKLIKKEYIAEIDSTVLQFEHQKTKAQLVAVKNNDTNNNFCISFKTIIENSTGVAHIMEHSVLQGSIKYPVRGAFYELYKGGLNTRPMCAPDKAYYQFSSRNLKEYFNVMDVYLDLTLNPLLKEETFMQEGWHYDLFSENDKVVYKGVVYNEMKAQMSTFNRYLMEHLYATMYQGTIYGNNSGGDPKVIPNLSYEEFKQFHADYYHPSNATIYLYGNAPLNDELQLINDNFLSKFDYKFVDSTIKPDPKIKKFTTKTVTYAVAPDSDLANKAHFALGIDLVTAKSRETILAMNIIVDLLFNSESSLLKQEIIASGIGQDFEGELDDQFMYFTNLNVFLTNTNEDKKERFLNIYYNTLKKIVASGFAKKDILAVLNQLELKKCESSIDAHRGFNYMFSVVNAVSYGLDVFDALKHKVLFANMREKATNSRYLEDLIEKYLLDNSKTTLVVMNPDPQKAKNDEAEEKAHLAVFENSLTQVERSELIIKCNQLLAFQNQKESSENIQKIPKLSLSDLDRQINFKKAKSQLIGDTPILTSEYFTNDILYASVGWRLDKIPLELLPFIEIFSWLLSEIGTKNRTYEQLNCEIQTYLGGFETKFAVNTSLNSYQSIMWIETKTLSKNIDKMLELITDICNNPDFSNHQRIEEVVLRKFTLKEKEIQSIGWNYSVVRINAYLSNQGQFSDYLTGMRSYQKLKSITNNFTQARDDLLDNLLKIREILFNRENMIINITADQKGLDLFIQKGVQFVDSFNNRHFDSIKLQFPITVLNQAFLTQSRVVFAAYGANIFQCGLNYSGGLEVLKKILYSYLFDKIRLQGGAYNCYVTLNKCDGYLSFTSIRDPNVKETYDIFDGITKAVFEQEMSEEQFNNIKLGAYAEFNMLQNVYNKGILARDSYLTGLTPEHFNKTIAEILDTTIEDLRAMAPALEKFTQSAYRCIIGNGSKIEANKELFSELIQV